MHTTDASQWTHHHDFCGDFWRSVRATEGPNQPLGPEQNALIPVLKPSPSRQLPNSALDPLILERIVIQEPLRPTAKSLAKHKIVRVGIKVTAGWENDLVSQAI